MRESRSFYERKPFFLVERTAFSFTISFYFCFFSKLSC